MKDIYWIADHQKTGVAIVARPRRDEWLADDLANLKRGGIDTLVSLLTEPEAAELGLENESAVAQQLEIEFLSYPISDRCTPADHAGYAAFISRLAQKVRAGKTVGAHCRGCIGRATVTTAALLIHLGWDAKDALAAIEQARGCPVPDTPEQCYWIQHYRPAR
jgi:protein-tyrosine phosphatase